MLAMHIYTATLTFLVAGAAGFSMLPDDMKHPVLVPAMPWDSMEQDLLAAMPARKSTVEPWPVGIIPTSCHQTPWNDTHFFDSADMNAFSVTYEDCFAPWIICHHKDSHDSVDRVVEYFGRMPLGLRENIKTLTIVPTRPNGILAWETNDIVVFQGSISLGVLSHEITHSLDFDRRDPATGKYLSETMMLNTVPVTKDGTTVNTLQLDDEDAPFANLTVGDGHTAASDTVSKIEVHEGVSSTALRWTNAVKSDTAAVSQYSLANCVEHFAEIGRAAIYDTIMTRVQSRLPPPPPPAVQLAKGLMRINANASQVMNAVHAWQYIFEDYVTKTGNCTVRKQMPLPMGNDPAVAGKFDMGEGVVEGGIRLRLYPEGSGGGVTEMKVDNGSVREAKNESSSVGEVHQRRHLRRQVRRRR